MFRKYFHFQTLKMANNNLNHLHFIENVISLKNDYDKLKLDLTKLENTEIVDIYYSELTELEKML